MYKYEYLKEIPNKKWDLFCVVQNREKTVCQLYISFKIKKKIERVVLKNEYTLIKG